MAAYFGWFEHQVGHKKIAKFEFLSLAIRYFALEKGSLDQFQDKHRLLFRNGMYRKIKNGHVTADISKIGNTIALLVHPISRGSRFSNAKEYVEPPAFDVEKVRTIVL